jgi:acetolactate synthase small subunit
MLKELTFVVSAENHPDLLDRTLFLFRRLAIPIHELAMGRPQDAFKMRVTIEVLADPELSERIVANLAKLVHVHSINGRKQNADSAHKPRLALSEHP